MATSSSPAPASALRVGLAAGLYLVLVVGAAKAGRAAGHGGVTVAELVLAVALGLAVGRAWALLLPAFVGLVFVLAILGGVEWARPGEDTPGIACMLVLISVFVADLAVAVGVRLRWALDQR
jgi:hypothetical protein